MLLYTIYNALLIQIADLSNPNKCIIGYVDNTTLLASGKNLCWSLVLLQKIHSCWLNSCRFWACSTHQTTGIDSMSSSNLHNWWPPIIPWGCPYCPCQSGTDRGATEGDLPQDLCPSIILSNNTPDNQCHASHCENPSQHTLNSTPPPGKIFEIQPCWCRENQTHTALPGWIPWLCKLNSWFKGSSHWNWQSRVQ